MRILLGSVVMVALVAVSVGVAQDRRERAPQPREGDKGRPLQFDTERFFKDFDKNGDGFLQRDELPAELRGAFERIDANRDGRISREELARGVTHLQPRRRPSDMVYMLIEMSDADADSAAEVQRAYDILRKLDKNRDGKIDPDELKKARSQLLKDRIDSLFKQLDSDGDGRISRAEAKGQIRQDFEELDRNRDGYIDKDELSRAAVRPTAPPAGREGERRPLPPDRRDQR